MSDKFDVGGTFSFVYGLEGVPSIAPGSSSTPSSSST
jgi:hypothetical protein